MSEIQRYEVRIINLERTVRTLDQRGRRIVVPFIDYLLLEETQNAAITDHAAALRERDERVAALEKALRNLCDSIEAAGGHDENGDVFDLTEAIVALEAK